MGPWVPGWGERAALEAEGRLNGGLGAKPLGIWGPYGTTWGPLLLSPLGGLLGPCMENIDRPCRSEGPLSDVFCPWARWEGGLARRWSSSGGGGGTVGGVARPRLSGYQMGPKRSRTGPKWVRKGPKWAPNRSQGPDVSFWKNKKPTPPLLLLRD